MSDALSLLRNFVKAKKEFHEEEDKIVFGDVFYYKNVKTPYLIYGTGKDDKSKEYYNLECLVFLIKNRDLQHSMYVKNAGTRCSVVLRPDRRELLSYLDGEIETSASIDKYAPIEIAMQRPQPYIKPSANAASKRPAMGNDDESESANDSSHSKLAKAEYKMDTSEQLNSSGQQQHASASQTTKEMFIGRLAQKFDSSQSSRPITENIVSLSNELSIEKIVSIKLKKKAQQRTKVSAGVEIDDDLLTTNGALSGQGQSATGKNGNDENNRSLNSLKYNFDNANGSAKMSFVSGISVVGTDDSDTIMREIIQRERVCRNRFSVLQSTGKQFDKDISAFLQSIKAKEEGAELNNSSMLSSTQLTNTGGLASTQQSNAQKSRALGYNRFDQERYSAKDETGGFGINTKLTYQPNGGSISLTPNPNNGTPPNPLIGGNAAQSIDKASQLNKSAGYFQSTQLSQSKPNLPSATPTAVNPVKAKYQSVTSAPLQKRSHSNPIIIIPSTRTSLIQMINALDILQELKFISTDEKKKMLNNQNFYKESELVMHRKDDGQTIQFKVIDNINKLQPHDWDRVVAVFAQGAQWQFKDWPLGEGNPTEIFNKVKGFHLKLSGIPLDNNIAKWSVTTIELDPHKRHLDRARLLTFWDELDKFMSKIKPHLYA